MADAKQLHVYSAGRWVVASGGGASDTHIVSAAEPPPGTEVGQLWIDPDGEVAAGDSAITVHDGTVPQPLAPMPQAIEDAFAGLTDGLHYYKDAGSLVAVARQEFQTSITITGPVKSYAKIVKSAAGLPTPQNPSTLVTCDADGKWFKLTGDELDKPFGPPQVVDIFSLNGGDPATVDLSDYYTKHEVDVEIDANFQQADGNLAFVAKGLGDAIALKADKASVYTKTESDRKFLDYQYFNDNAYYGPSVTFKDTFGTVRWKTSNFGDGTGPDAILAIAGWGDPNVPNSPVVPRLYFEATDEIGGYLAYSDDHYTKAEVDAAISNIAPTPATDLSDYAKKDDASQNVIANAFVGQGFVFGTEVVGSNPGLVYTDTNEGYGPRLVLGTTGGVEYIPYLSDFDPIKARMEALESKQAVGVDAAAAAEAIQKVDLLGMEVGLSASACKNTAEKVQELEARITAINPTGAVDINDPSLAAFKQSVLDEVKKMMAGGKTVPADVEWTKILNTGSTVAEAKVLNGVVYLRGVVTKSIGAGYIANVCQLPPTIPAPLAEMVFPLAMKRTSPSLRAFGYATFQTDGQIGVSCDSSSDTVWLDGISYTAYE